MRRSQAASKLCVKRWASSSDENSEGDLETGRTVLIFSDPCGPASVGPQLTFQLLSLAAIRRAATVGNDHGSDGVLRGATLASTCSAHSASRRAKSPTPQPMSKARPKGAGRCCSKTIMVVAVVIPGRGKD